MNYAWKKCSPLFCRQINLQTALRSAGSAKTLSLLASLDTSFDSILAITASRNNREGSGRAKGAEAAFTFAVISGQLSTEMVLASQATVGEAIGSGNEAF